MTLFIFNLNKERVKLLYILCAIGSLQLMNSCKKKGCTDETALNYSTEAKKDDGSCTYFTVPTSYTFTDEAGNNTVSYTGQTERLNQLEEMTTYLKSGTTAALDLEVINAMFNNTDGNGAGNFSFSSSKQLKDKCFASDLSLFDTYFNAQVLASASCAETATSGQAGTLSSGSSTYLFGANGMEYTQLIEKGLMGAIFLNQALEVYFGAEKMNVDNSVAEDPRNGAYYTTMEHHWDEAFGYFGAPIDFPTNTDGLRFWAKYCNSQNANLNCNATLMNAFLKGRAAITQGENLVLRDEAIAIIQIEWEKLVASQAKTYLEGAKANFGTDNAKFLHELSEAYAFILCLKYVPLGTRTITYATIDELLTTHIGSDLWSVTLTDLNNAIDLINSTYSF